ncbi:hypothetical protein [Polyangium jinanense]|uniref:DUF5050 domain-containing protein n=1 Tax=Polyangium jinanense TaxID=2829994 RepID=A0A9X3X5L6_9BACT|nr:hypothetical protein [Polyangium jinanense]MDC3954193.1 hypothetical protein [Polyangium jinanense]MDC3981851.1 hypothetical protein [Polyangium jinanense]
MLSRPSFLPGLLLAAIALPVTACWLDLDRLGAGLPSAAAGGGSNVGSSTMSGTGGGGTGAPVLECDPCPEGGCSPEPVAEGPAFALGAVDLVADSDGVYWVNQEGGEVMRFVSTADAPETLTTAVAPRCLVVRGGNVFYGDDEGLWSCSADACMQTRQKVTSSVAQGTIGRIAFDGASVYWTDRGTAESDGRVYGCAPGDCTTPKEYATGLFRPDTILASGGQLFWVQFGNGNANGAIYQGSPGGSATTVASALAFPSSVAVDNDSFYFPSWRPGGTVHRCPKSGYCSEPPAIKPAEAGEKPFDVAVSGGRVYWSDTADGAIRSCPAAGCGAEAPRVHVSGRTGLSRFALGKACIFWVDATNGGSVMKVGR